MIPHLKLKGNVVNLPYFHLVTKLRHKMEKRVKAIFSDGEIRYFNQVKIHSDFEEEVPFGYTLFIGNENSVLAPSSTVKWHSEE